MRGAIVFLSFFILLTAVSLAYPGLPPGPQIYGVLGIAETEYLILGIPATNLVIGVFNGVVYGVIAWLLYGFIERAGIRTKQPKEVVSEEPEKGKEETVPLPKPVEEPTEPLVKPVSVKKTLTSLDQGIEYITGLEPSYAEKLREINITTIRDLLDAGATRKGRRVLAKATDTSEENVLKWVNCADLFRVRGIGKEYSDLLNAAGIKTVLQLSRRNPANLHMKLVEINKDQMYVKQLPSVDTITEWIRHAKNLKRKIEY